MNKCHACKSAIGYFAFSDKGEVIFYTLFSNDPEKAIDEFTNDDDKEFLSNLKDYDVCFDNIGQEFMRKHIRELALSLNFSNTVQEFNNFIIDFSRNLSKKLMVSSIRRDKLLVQAFHAYEDLNIMINNLNERLYEWYSLHYPDVQQASLSRLVQKHGKRENFPGFKASHGIDINENDEKMFIEYSALIISMEEEKKRIEKYISEFSKELMPNTTSIIDEVLATRLLSLAGSLEKLARMTASSIQLLGAEKALFRHLKNKRERAPKYGVIFNSSWVQSVSQDGRGRVARVLASKIMLAARIDYYSGRLDETIRKSLEEELRR
jgi:nucleolar protein 56